MQYRYKVFPLSKPNPAFPEETSAWLPILPVRLSYQHSRLTPPLEAIVDSGAADCLFRADIADYIGIKLDKGRKGLVHGVVHGPKLDVFYHDVSLWVGSDRISIAAGFAHGLTVGALLGRRGFFENFIVTFDPSANPPGFEVQRLGRA